MTLGKGRPQSRSPFQRPAARAGRPLLTKSIRFLTPFPLFPEVLPDDPGVKQLIAELERAN